jgi:hypothetical protein
LVVDHVCDEDTAMAGRRDDNSGVLVDFDAVHSLSSGGVLPYR